MNNEQDVQNYNRSLQKNKVNLNWKRTQIFLTSEIMLNGMKISLKSFALSNEQDVQNFIWQQNIV